MRKGKRIRVQRRARDPIRFGGVIQRVSQQRMTHCHRMDSDLVRPARHRLRFEQDVSRIPSEDFEARLGSFSAS